jgi:hypothetical protein
VRRERRWRVIAHYTRVSKYQKQKQKQETKKKNKNKTLNGNDNVQGAAADGYCACADTERAKKKVRRDGFRNAHITDSRSTGSSFHGIFEYGCSRRRG